MSSWTRLWKVTVIHITPKLPQDIAGDDCALGVRDENDLDIKQEKKQANNNSDKENKWKCMYGHPI